MKTTLIKYFVLAVLLWFFAVPCYPGAGEKEPQSILYFYNSETNINNFVSLKITFDTYLSQFGDYYFQPFSDQSNFESFVAENDKGVMLLSSWHYSMLKDQASLVPALIGVSNNKTTQRKILSTQHDIESINDLKGKKIATASNISYSENLLREMVGSANEDVVSSVKFVLVPKDIDALMAVGFGIASAALTSEKSLENFKDINEKQYSQLRQLGISKEILLTLAVVHQKADAGAAKLLATLMKMSTNPDGKLKLRMLGLDDWRPLTPSELATLNVTEVKGK
ncbi:MAG: hypothetical protein EPN21_18885 [Methylococcaceae bacterium]|nr:MAG: hypothetical protein EPN21_18885 [Methylococcaceae bacterium]